MKKIHIHAKPHEHVVVHRNNGGDGGGGVNAGCGYLIALCLIGWLVMKLLPYIIMGAVVCLVVWLIVRFPYQTLALLKRIGMFIVLLVDCLSFLAKAVFHLTQWLFERTAQFIAERRQQTSTTFTPSLATPPLSPAPESTTNGINAQKHPGWKLKPPR